MATIKISFTVPSVLQDEVRKAVVGNGYGLRGKSKWASEAITSLLAQKNFSFLVNLSDELSGLDKTETICIEPKLKKVIDAAVLQIRKEYMSMEGIQSRIIRTAIMQRLLRGAP
jgi:hypothetical protein